MSARIETDEQSALRAHVRQLLDRTWGDTQVLEYADGDVAVAGDVSSALADTFGLTDLVGDGGDQAAAWLEAVLVAEELGAALAPSEILGDAMAASVLRSFGETDRARVLTALDADGATCRLVWPGADASWDGASVGAAVADGRVTIAWSDVPELGRASTLLVPCGDLGVGIVRAGDLAASQIEVVASADVLRPLYRVDLSNQDCEIIRVADAQAGIRRTVALGAVVLAGEMVGGAAACLKRVVDHTTTRTQFGRPLASFQALKHRIADVVVELEAARSITYRAAARAVTTLPGAPGDDEVVTLARAAKAAAGDALHRAATECVQMHGAMGFTWELPVHIYLKRWVTSSALFGRAFEQRRHVFRAEVAARTA